MSDTYHPQPWLSPNPGGVQRPMGVQVNVTLPSDANQADTGALMRFAHDIVQGNGPQLDRFVAGQRQQQSINPLPYKEVSVRMERMRARWRMNNGLESLLLDVYPAGGEEVGASATDTDLDGYAAWVHAEPGGPFGPTPGGVSQDVNPYNIFMNGYSIEEDYTPVLPCGGYVILFGKTAMLEPSYVGEKEQRTVQGPTPPNRVVPPHGWGNYPAGSNGLVTQQEYAKTFGYWILDWLNVLNPCQYLDFGDGTTVDIKNWLTASFGDAKPGAPVFDRGMYFLEPSKSPLLPRGKNGVSAFLSPRSFWFGQGAEIILIDVWTAEFYDRGAYRRAQQSWTVAPKPRQIVAVNDKPMLFGRGYWTGGFSAGAGMDFDLDPATTKQFKDTNAAVFQDTAQMGAHDYLHNVFQPSNGLNGLDADERAQFDTWAQQERDAGAAFNTKLEQETQAWTDKWNETENKKQLNRAQQIEYFLSTMQDASGNRIPGPGTWGQDAPNGTDEVWTFGEGHLPIFGPVQQYLWDWDATFGTDPHTHLPHIGRYILTWGPENGGTTTLFDTAPQAPATPGPNQSWMTDAGPTWMTIDQLYTFALEYAKTDAIHTKNKEYLDIISQKPPDANKGPPLGKSLNAFKHSNITIAGTQWSYDQNPR